MSFSEYKVGDAVVCKSHTHHPEVSGRVGEVIGVHRMSENVGSISIRIPRPPSERGSRRDDHVSYLLSNDRRRNRLVVSPAHSEVEHAWLPSPTGMTYLMMAIFVGALVATVFGWGS